MASSTLFSKGCRALMAAAKTPAQSGGGVATKTRRPVGILKPMPVSPALGAFLGVSEASRTDVVKKVWQHIKLNNLQNPENKKEIFCDEKLKKLFDGKDKVGFLEIAKLLSPHFVKS
ncbi:hypothetical protein Vadar_024130 [Vaccinium darrowii]|uniref:Uncharacterized protein n=1 Tax=Vaccinium darrowii TaxID=229202 RepID=A0ACB7X376_9ERIC|nr:hypothetical protein Vadar_024130 [Vaccinium darrowii]